MKLNPLFKLKKENEKFTIDDDGVTCTSNARKGKITGHWTEATQQSHHRKSENGWKTFLIAAHHFPISIRIITLLF